MPDTRPAPETAATELRNYHAIETLRNGITATIRAIRPDDKDRLAAAFRNLERESVYTRFFGYRSEPNAMELKVATEVNFEKTVALVVTRTEGQPETIIGSGRYFMTIAASGRRTAEVAFIVEEDYHGLGIASRILKHLVAIARQQGIAVFEADILPGNAAMIAVLARSGLDMKQRREDGFVHVTLEL